VANTRVLAGAGAGQDQEAGPSGRGHGARLLRVQRPDDLLGAPRGGRCSTASGSTGGRGVARILAVGGGPSRSQAGSSGAAPGSSRSAKTRLPTVSGRGRGGVVERGGSPVRRRRVGTHAFHCRSGRSPALFDARVRVRRARLSGRLDLVGRWGNDRDRLVPVRAPQVDRQAPSRRPWVITPLSPARWFGKSCSTRTVRATLGAGEVDREASRAGRRPSAASWADVRSTVTE